MRDGRRRGGERRVSHGVQGDLLRKLVLGVHLNIVSIVSYMTW